MTLASFLFLNFPATYCYSRIYDLVLKSIPPVVFMMEQHGKATDKLTCIKTVSLGGVPKKVLFLVFRTTPEKLRTLKAYLRMQTFLNNWNVSRLILFWKDWASFWSKNPVIPQEVS